jgi:hypothetical protein
MGGGGEQKMPLTADSLVSTKLRPLEARPKLVARPRLTEKLERESGRRLTLISAPAGFGKSTLLGEWLSRYSPRVRGGSRPAQHCRLGPGQGALDARRTGRGRASDAR